MPSYSHSLSVQLCYYCSNDQPQVYPINSDTIYLYEVPLEILTVFQLSYTFSSGLSMTKPLPWHYEYPTSFSTYDTSPFSSPTYSYLTASFLPLISSTFTTTPTFSCSWFDHNWLECSAWAERTFYVALVRTFGHGSTHPASFAGERTLIRISRYCEWLVSAPFARLRNFLI